MVRKGWTPAALAISLALAAFPVAADASFTVSPTSIRMDLKRGDAGSGTFDVRVANEEKGTQYEIEVQDIVQLPDGSTSYEPPSDSPFSASNWVSINPASFSGTPRRTQPVEYTVRAPAKAPPGDHVTSLTVKRIPKDSGEIAESVQAVSVRLTVNVFGKARRSAEITSLDAPGVAAGNPLEATAEVENTGNVTLELDGEQPGSIAIVQGDDEKAVTEFTGDLYPGQSREFAVSWGDAPLFGQFRAVAELDTGPDALSESKEILKIPWRQLGALVLVVLAAVVLVAGRRSGRF